MGTRSFVGVEEGLQKVEEEGRDRSEDSRRKKSFERVISGRMKAETQSSSRLTVSIASLYTLVQSRQQPRNGRVAIIS